MARKLIGTGVTDENGEATITYKGTGAGKLNIVAESGTFVSGTFVVTDGIAFDKGILNDPQTRNIWSPNGTASINRGDTGTTCNLSAYEAVFLKLDNSTNIPFVNGLCIEFDVSCTNYFRCNIADSSAHVQTLTSGHWKIIMENSKCTITPPNGQTYDFAFDTTVQTFQFNYNTNVASYTNDGVFSNFILYPI